MLRRLLLLALLPLGLQLSSCSNASTDGSSAPAATTDSTDAPAPEPMDTTTASVANAQTDTLKVVRKRHLFSSPSAPDLFMLALRGDSLLSSEATFTITASDGTVIFRETLSSADLEASMVYQMNKPGASRTERQAFLQRRLDTFFADNNFLKPAIPATQAYQPGTIEHATWDDLRRRPEAIGFQYLVGKEDGRRIAWSPLKKQVVRYDGFGG